MRAYAAKAKVTDARKVRAAERPSISPATRSAIIAPVAQHAMKMKNPLLEEHKAKIFD
jgi:hypothetical protein